ncbi:MAG TPA: phytanoyl-CoA dioxygenase family protein [Acetobacteraceae bacterium]|jgi:non-heme Fe2+,alpha-ketoglutarate-dependent halogenase|nr:phytanoyl-CoA dioxygenase family protein [Acetobacteraceae bacterium]
MLNTVEIDRYATDGYLPGRPLLTGAETAYYRAGCERCCGPLVKDGGRKQSTNRVKPYLLFPWAAELVRHTRILDCVQDLIGPDIMVFHTTVWLKEPHSESFVPWHQDATYFGLTPFEHVTAWVALTDSTPENGCVQIIPRSHATGQRPHFDQPDPRAMLSRGQTLADSIEEDRAIDLVLRAGEVSFHHTLSFHRSGINHTDTRRIGIGVSYIPTHVRHVGATRLSASLVRGIDRYGHFDHEPAPQAEDAAARLAHADSVGRFWKASESIPAMAMAH